MFMIPTFLSYLVSYLCVYFIYSIIFFLYLSFSLSHCGPFFQYFFHQLYLLFHLPFRFAFFLYLSVIFNSFISLYIRVPPILFQSTPPSLFSFFLRLSPSVSLGTISSNLTEYTGCHFKLLLLLLLLFLLLLSG